MSSPLTPPQGILDCLRRGQRFAVTSHQRPDGDSIGSELALALALRQMGKRVQVYNRDPIPDCYAFLPGVEDIRTALRIDSDYDAVIILECSSLQRTGLLGLDGYWTVNIDHHDGCPHYADLNWVDPTAAAVGLLVHRLLKALGLAIGASIATNLYVALMTDTGSFQYSNTDREAFQMAADLVAQGAQPDEIAWRVYRHLPASKLSLLQKALEGLQIHPNGKIAWVSLTPRDFEECDALGGDTEGLVNYPLSIRGVEAAAFFREADAGSVRVSLRSHGDADVAAVARQFGGGGHRNAAGMAIEGRSESVVQAVLNALQEMVTFQR